MTSAGVVLAGLFTVRFQDDVQAFVEASRFWGFLVAALVCAVGGGTVLWRSGHARTGLALVVAAALVSVWNVWELLIRWQSSGTGALQAGFWLVLLGHLGVLACGALSVSTLRAEKSVTPARWRSRRRAAAPVAALSALAAGPIVAIGLSNGEAGSTGYLVHDASFVVLLVLVPLVAVLVPADVGRPLLIGWVVGAAGLVLTYWRLLDINDQPTYGIGLSLVPLAAQLALALAATPWRAGSPAAAVSR